MFLSRFLPSDVLGNLRTGSTQPHCRKHRICVLVCLPSPPHPGQTLACTTMIIGTTALHAIQNAPMLCRSTFSAPSLVSEVQRFKPFQVEPPVPGHSHTRRAEHCIALKSIVRPIPRFIAGYLSVGGLESLQGRPATLSEPTASDSTGCGRLSWSRFRPRIGPYMFITAVRLLLAIFLSHLLSVWKDCQSELRHPDDLPSTYVHLDLLVFHNISRPQFYALALNYELPAIDSRVPNRPLPLFHVSSSPRMHFLQRCLDTLHIHRALSNVCVRYTPGISCQQRPLTIVCVFGLLVCSGVFDGASAV